jgi:hypothetical protein
MRVRSMRVPGSPVTLDDIVDAARILLRRYQRHYNETWRTDRWYSDDDLAQLVAQSREQWLYRGFSMAGPDTVFSVPIAFDVLLVGLPFTPAHLISSLYQLGLCAEQSTDEDFAYAFDLLDDAALLRPVAKSGFPLSEVRVVTRTVGEGSFLLMLAAGMSASEILDSVYSGERLDDSALQMLAAFRTPVHED